MARKERDEVTLTDAAGEIGISRAALYGRVQRAKRRGEAVPFRKRGKQGRLVAARKAFDTWAARWTTANAKTDVADATPPREPTMTREETPIKIPSSSSGNAVGDPLAASAEVADVPAVTEPVPTVGAPVIDDLPPSYMENRVTALLHDPDRIAVYWDVNPETAKAHAGKRWGILVRTADGERLVEIEHGARIWYIDMPDVGLAHEIHFGPIEDGAVRPVAHTALAPAPPPAHETTSDGADVDARWGRQETDGATSLVVEAPRPDAFGPAAGVATVNAEELRRVSSGGSGSSGGLTSPGLSRPGA